MAVIKDTAFILSIQKHLAPELRIRLLPGRGIAMAKTESEAQKNCLRKKTGAVWKAKDANEHP